MVETGDCQLSESRGNDAGKRASEEMNETQDKYVCL